MVAVVARAMILMAAQLPPWSTMLAVVGQQRGLTNFVEEMQFHNSILSHLRGPGSTNIFPKSCILNKSAEATRNTKAPAMTKDCRLDDGMILDAWA